MVVPQRRCRRAGLRQGHVQQPGDVVHLALARPQPALVQPLLGRHAPDVVVEQEPRRQQWYAATRGAACHGATRGAAAVHRYVQAPAVFLVARHLYVLREMARN